jgi:SHS2 domain-containing protein
MKKKTGYFQIMDHTADVGIIAYGYTLAEAFESGAKGLLSILVDESNIKHTIIRRLDLQANDLESLLVSWLNELIFLFDSENLIFSRFNISEIDNNHLIALCYGEKIDPKRHQVKTGVKAATFHELKIEDKNGFRLQVLLDI